ncbi:hypothetical protein SDC9_100930 [bioreactor metagenome]|uniref:Uncharacterized protein n=1 Tax=bioreactor metagenome TaxID=1076179 RepID=A0A645AM87_9ZZZZ
MAGKEGGQRHGQNVGDHAADDLVGLKPDAEHRVKKRIHHAAQHGEGHGQIHGGLTSGGKAARQKGGSQRAHKGPEALNALQSQHGNAAALAVYAADGDDKQGQGKGKTVDDHGAQDAHVRSSSASALPARCRSASRWRTRSIR